ncbi:MAG: hypothetical protein J5958_05390 [Clostridia bacterium]|nr:hypothetical protein [Clostridia bacterium]
MKTLGRVAVFGDSYSTFEGCIPEGYNTYYGKDKHVETGVLRREDTWWDQLIRETHSTLVLNNSYSGSTVCYTGRENFPVSSSFAARAPRFFDGTVPLDTIVVLGGTNDSWIDSPLGDPAIKEWDAYTEEDKKDVLPSIGYTVGFLRARYPAARIVTVINSGLKPEIAGTLKNAAEKNRCIIVELTDVSKVHGHPDRAGMTRIKELILKAVFDGTN